MKHHFPGENLRLICFLPTDFKPPVHSEVLTGIMGSAGRQQGGGGSTGVCMAQEVWSHSTGEYLYRRGKAPCVCVCIRHTLLWWSGQVSFRSTHNIIYTQKSANNQHKSESLQKYTSVVMSLCVRVCLSLRGLRVGGAIFWSPLRETWFWLIMGSKVTMTTHL